MNNNTTENYSHLVDDNGNIIYSENPLYKFSGDRNETVTITNSNDLTASTSTITINYEGSNRHNRRKALALSRRKINGRSNNKTKRN